MSQIINNICNVKNYWIGLIVAYKLLLIFINNLYFVIYYLRDYAGGVTGTDNFEG